MAAETESRPSPGTGRPLAVGIVACLVLLAVVVAPFVLSSADAAALTLYYQSAPVGPWILALFALVSIIVFQSGRLGRADPETVAGGTLGLGVAVVAVALWWALSVDPSLVLQLGNETWLEYHRWVVLLVSLAIPFAGGWYARELGLT